MLHAVIMAGGSGTRFWPQSRRALPKQFLTFQGSRTLLQETAARCQPAIDAERIWIVTGAALAAETRRQVPEVAPEHVLLEPCGRNTAPCVGLAAMSLLAADPQARMVVMPADHVIAPASAFQQAFARAAAILDEHPRALVLFGVKPSYPSTSFGYIERGAAVDAAAGLYRVGSFREKPDAATAGRYVESGSYYWNCGIFVWGARTILELLGQHEPELGVGLSALGKHLNTPGWNAALDEQFPKLKSISIDYAVLERAEEVYVLEAPFGWDDVGSWQALERLKPADAQGNTVDGTFVGVDTRGCIIRGQADHLIATLGMENCIIVQTPHATLVTQKGNEEAVRQLIKAIEQQGLERFL
ncbi:MAG: mannose-1-phosphate guanylyltransferase [Planctomycetes bacterium]|nr:mannose-1-phosphate guanylyltransferase [Planctomycetota bacterium]